MTTELEEKVTGVMKTAITESSPKFDEIFPVDIQYTANGRWHTVEVSGKEYLAMLQNGFLDEKQITAVCVNEINVTLADDSTEKLRIVYDFVLKHQERDPWRYV